MVGVGEVKTYVKFRDNERGGLVMTPIYGDWLRTVKSKPQVSWLRNIILTAVIGSVEVTSKQVDYEMLFLRC